MRHLFRFPVRFESPGVGFYLCWALLRTVNALL
jgi:hypothetical protein